MALYNTTTKQEFDEKVIKSDKLVLVDFWATWCPPCRAMAPLLEQFAEDKGVDVVKIDIEKTPENGALAQQHGVRGIPNMQLYKDGKVVDTIVGMTPLSGLREVAKAHL